MKTWFRYSALVAAAATAFAFAACSDDDNNPPTGPDTTAPAVASVTSVDVNHVNVRFSENVDRTSAEDEGNYSIVETSPSPSPGVSLAPGDPVAVTNASLLSDGRTVTLTTGTSMTVVGYRVTVNNVEDLNGNEVANGTAKEFAGSSTPDQTPPAIVFQSPAGNANNVSTTDSLSFTFSEPLSEGNFESSFALRAGVNDVPVTITSDDNVHFIVSPNHPLSPGQLYTVSFTGVSDEAGNLMDNSESTFHTSGTTDSTAPTLISSVPSNNATNVATSSTISMTFSEPIDQNDFTASIDPTLGLATPSFSEDGKTVTFTPPDGLAANQQYMVTILPGGVTDMHGNANDTAITVLFTTGAALQTATGVR